MDDEQFIDKTQNIDTNEPSQGNNFDIADTNNDQQLTEEEAKELPEVDTPQEFRLTDENDDRLISFDEYKKALSKEERNIIDNAPDKNDRYNAFNDALDKYYNEYVSTLDPNDPDYDDEVNLAKDDALDQLRNSGYRDYNPETGKDYIISPDFDPEKNIAKDAGVKSGIQETLDKAINEHNVDEMAELLNNVMPSLPSYTDTEKAENDKQEDTGEIWQEGISKDVYERLANWGFDELYELSKKVPDIKWKELANVVARGETSDEEDQEKRSKEWLQHWEDYVSKVDSTAKQLSELSNNHIEKDEVEQILYRDYVQENKEGTDKPVEETETTDTSAMPTSAVGDDKKPIQITEKTDVRERIIREAAHHIMTHGKSLPKELKKSVQEISAKFQPFKFEHKKSKKDTGENLTHRRTKVKPEKLYSKYHANDGDFERISAINHVVEKLEKKGYVETERENFGTELKSIYLVDRYIEEIEHYLMIHYQYESKDSKIQKVKALIGSYQHASKICQMECEELNEMFIKRQIPNNLDELDNILKAVAFIDNNEKNLYVREMSMEVYGDSKFFEENTMESVCTILRKYNHNQADEIELKEEILSQYHIFKEPQKLSIKGRAIIRIDGRDADITGFADGIEFSASELEKIDEIKILASNFITIENRTSYLRYKNDNTVTFYLGGYANRDQRDFLKHVYKDNPYKNYLHFGDIDAGGLWIHNHLCKITGINFGLFCMSEKELEDPVYKKCLRKLSENDITRMQELKDIPDYKDVVDYMLKNKVKLEQEIVSLRLMSK